MAMRTVTRAAVCAAGLHARPAAVFVKAVLDSGGQVSIGRPDGETGDARSIVSVLALDIQAGEAVVLSGDDQRLIERLADLLEAGSPGLPQQDLPQPGLPQPGLQGPGLPQAGLLQQDLPQQDLPQPGSSQPGSSGSPETEPGL